MFTNYLKKNVADFTNALIMHGFSDSLQFVSIFIIGMVKTIRLSRVRLIAIFTQ